MNEPVTLTVPVENVAEFKRRFGLLTARAVKLGAPVPVFALGDLSEEVTTRRGKKVRIEYRDITVTGEAPKFAGWSLVARVDFDHSEPLFAAAPGETVPESYRGTDATCDHCKKVRARKNVFILRNEAGDTIKVGRNCIKDFLGHNSPENVLRTMTWLRDLASMLDEAGDEDRWGSFGGAYVPTWPVVTVLEFASACIRRSGWCSGGAAWASEDKTSTKGEVLYFMDPPNPRPRGFVPLIPDETDEANAKAAIEYAATLKGRNDYEFKLGVIARDEWAGWKDIGILVSLIPAWMRHVEREIEYKKKRAAEPVSNHFGEIKKREVFTLTVESVRYLESDWGVTVLYMFRDLDGNVAKWFASREHFSDMGEHDAPHGLTYRVKATVKAHGDWKGRKETVLTRAAVIERVETEKETAWSKAVAP